MNLSHAPFSLLVFLALGCQSTASGDAEPVARPAPAEEQQKDQGETWQARGIIKRLEPERGTITIHHEDVPGYMPSMTMPFWVESPSQLEGIAVGDTVEFRFRRGEGGKHFLVSIRKR